MRRPIKILAFFLHPCEYGKYVGGSERRFLEISTRLRKLRVETFALEYKPSLAEKWGYSAYHSIGINRRFINHAVLETVRAFLYGIKACIRNKCDIVYVPNRGVFGYSSTINLLSAYVVSVLCQKPLIIVFHHLTPTDYNNKNIIRLLAHRHAEACIAVSHATADDVRKTFKVKRLIIATNGVNLDIFAKIKSQTKLYDAVFFGRITEEKGIFTLLKAWKTVTTQTPSAQLLLLGGATERMKNACKKTINELGLGRNVAISGFVSDQEAIRLIKSSRIFVFPSKAEGFGLVVAEAMAAGLPCILSNLPALKENFHSAAIFVEPKDAKGLAQAILALLSDPDKCRKLKKRGQRLVKQFSWEAVAKKELKVFKSVIEY
jgi:glycosyltransferase involved in cell wall biosynthesis